MSEVRRETTFTSDPDEVWHAISDERELEQDGTVGTPSWTPR